MSQLVEAPFARKHSAPAESSVVVVGNVRNCGKWIAKTIEELRAALSCFKDIQWLLVESDSDDDSRVQLARLAKRIDRFEVRHLGTLRDRIPLRTERLAYCRNTYLSEIKAAPRYSGVDYVLVVDLDGLTGALTSAGLASCWERDDWDVCGANQRGPYYDIWTLRHPFWSPNDCWEQVRVMTAFGVSKEEAESAAVYSRMVEIPEAAAWIEVESAFGGLAVYRRDAIVRGSYGGLSSQGEEVSDHIALHQELRDLGYRIFINPRLVNFVSDRSPDQDTPWQRVQRNVRDGIKAGLRRLVGEDGLTRITLLLRRVRG
ncbi:MAG: hypothetical protein NTZ43_02450 [Gemmatimonadetes bacterium]|nr:hypothetical protein [Gemmatimonadota bacterium]